jgi:hypothetical protein
MKKLLLSAFFLGCLSTNAQTTLFQDDFESYDDFLITGFGNWSTLDLDGRPTYTGGTEDDAAWDNAGDPQAWMIFNPTTALVSNATEGAGTPPSEENRIFDPHSGEKYAASWAAVPNGPQPANNDWLISPPITLGSEGNILSVWVRSMSDTYGLEEFSIGVFVGSGEPVSGDEFEPTSVDGVEAIYDDWEEKVVDLDAYSGQTIRIGIRNQGADHYMLMVDDFTVTTTGLGVKENLASKFSAYPNPANNTVNVSNNYNITLTSVNITDINGRIVKTINVNNLSEVQMNVSELNTGVYFMNIDTDSGKVVKKFIKV